MAQVAKTRGAAHAAGEAVPKPGNAAPAVPKPAKKDPDTRIKAALAKLSPEERKLAEAQRLCPVLEDSRLGSMGVPVKLTIDGEIVFVCCAGCKEEAHANAKETLRKIKELKQKHH